MLKTRNRISAPLHGLQNDLESFFDHLVEGGRPADRVVAPRSNIMESDTSFLIQMELPGVSIDDIHVEVTEGKLVVSGEKRVNYPEGWTVHSDERSTGKIHRAFEFGTQVDADKIEANLKEGILELTLPKSEKVLPRKVDIKANG